MKKIPYKIPDYKELIKNEYAYVDKTMYLNKLEEAGNYFMFLRPFGFGKKLLTSMMYYYYDVNSIGEFEMLFKNTYVYDKPTPNKNNYYVLKFDFSNVFDYDELSFKKCVISNINSFLDYYNFQYKIDENCDINSILDGFFEYLENSKLSNKIYVIVVNYDYFVKLMVKNNEDGRNIKEFTDHIVFMYFILKKYSIKKLVDRIFISGEVELYLFDNNYGLDIVTNISSSPWFYYLCGFLDYEIVNSFLDIRDDIHMNGDFKNFYGGYKFGSYQKLQLFNPFFLFYGLNNYYKIIRNECEYYDVNCIDYELIKCLYDINGGVNDCNARLVNIVDFVSRYRNYGTILLYCYGVLTVKELDERVTSFCIPNETIKHVLEELS